MHATEQAQRLHHEGLETWQRRFDYVAVRLRNHAKISDALYDEIRIDLSKQTKDEAQKNAKAVRLHHITRSFIPQRITAFVSMYTGTLVGTCIEEQNVCS